MPDQLLFLPQNDSHAETAALLEPLLAEMGLRSIVLDMDGVFHQGTARYLGGMPRRPSRLATELPFYRLPPYRQVRVVAGARPLVGSWLCDASVVVAFNDGALQRLVLTEARRRGLPTHLVLDGMIGPREPSQSLRGAARGMLRAIGRRLGDRTIGSLFPSDLGSTAVDHIYVAGRHSVQVLRAQGTAARTISATGLPRWPEPEWSRPASVRRVLYLTGAFRWHDDPETAIGQEADVEALARVCAGLGLELIVRVHPRDDAQAYSASSAEIVDPRSEPMTTTIRRADLTLSFVSTGLFDSIILGKPTRVLAIHPRWGRYGKLFIADPIFQAIRDLDQLRAALTELAARADPVEVDRQRAGLEPYVAATGAEAARRIAAAIAAGTRRPPESVSAVS